MGLMTITGPLAKQILSNRTRWQYVDDVSDNIDQLTITFAGREFQELPDYGLEYELTIGGQSRSQFSIVSSSVNGHSDITLKLSPIAKNSEIKEKRTKSYVNTAIDEIVKDVVMTCGYQMKVAPAFADKEITINRENETAGDFLNRLAKEQGAVSKPYGKTWHFTEKHSKTNNAGHQRPTVYITNATRLISITRTREAKDTFKGVRVSWFDQEDGHLKKEQRGQAPFNDLGEVSELKAKEILKTYEKYNKNAVERLTVTFPSDTPDIGMAFAQGVLEVDRGRFFKGSYIIDSVTFTEYEVTIQASIPNE